ncbi:MAG: hypothetical protein EXS49_02270 [Candidatus Pacebacteria bacterium]|nr:hypothetical protein [Candidatus Paceibacterota bacterium]
MANINDLKKMFSKMSEEDLFASAYLFFGDNLKSQNDFLKSLGAFLETGDFKYEGILMDTLFLDVNLDGGIDVMRRIPEFIFQAPIKAKKKAVFILNVDNLTRHAQNAILRIVEEPPKRGIIFLGAKSAENILPTLLSRMQKFYFFEKNNDKVLTVMPQSEKFFFDFKKSSSNKERSEAIKKVMEEENNLVFEDFTNLIFQDYLKKFPDNWIEFKEFIKRITAIYSLNTNKKLQLESAVLDRE